MTPEELAKKHPKLYHIAEAKSRSSIIKHGLLTSKSLLKLFDVPNTVALETISKRRSKPFVLSNSEHEHAVLNDNLPLNETILAKCLEDGLSPSDWLSMLNSRVFFFTSRSQANKLLASSGNVSRQKIMLTLDTLSLAKTYSKHLEICPINSGATDPRCSPKRGLKTFTPLLKLPFSEWSLKRGMQDRIKEVTATCDLIDISNYITEVV